MSSQDSKELGRQIARLRKARGLSQADLAVKSGVPLTAIRRCEQQGRIPLDRYVALVSVLDATVEIHAATRQKVSLTSDTPHAALSPSNILSDFISVAVEHPAASTLSASPLPYKTISDVIAAAAKHSDGAQAVGGTAREFLPGKTARKPLLGGMFERSSNKPA